MKKKHIFTRVISFILCVAMVLPMFTMFPTISFAAGGKSDSAVNSTGSSEDTFYQNGVYYTIEKKTVYTGNNTYRFDVSLTSSLSKTENTVTRTAANNGYFVVDKSGYYLIELWGGDGAEGEDNDGILLKRPGGTGGRSGYVYARIYLERGQILVYSIGTDGKQSKRNNEESDGGVNGSGGELGENQGNYAVGAGGGFSALYIFNEGDTFDPSWITDDAINIPESYRLSRYVMIAAGGGGGGAGNGIAIENAKDKNGNYYTADGGYGGNIQYGVSVTVNDSEGNPKGYVFAGGDGGSSGTVTSYIGKGGTNRPGSCPTTLGGNFTATPAPNNWTGTANPDQSYGSGGGSVFRGGGGGAGYAGGSGGIMEAQMIPECVGGGGGGSSYIAATVGGREVQFLTLPEETSKYLSGNCPSSVGGAIVFTYLGGEETENIDTSFLKSVSISGSFVSDYFTIKNITSTSGTTTYSNTDGTFGVTGLDASPASASQSGATGKLSIVFVPKSGFAGGNNIELIKSVVANFTNSEGTAEKLNSSKSTASDNVNVAMNVVVEAKSIMTAEKNVTYQLSELYVNTYGSAITAFANGNDPGWQYDFIDNLSKYKIYNGQNGATGSEVTSAVTPTAASTYWSVVLTMTPKNIGSYALVGPRNTGAEDFYGIACVAIIDAESLILNGKQVFSNRYLTYNGTAYRMTDEITQTSISGSFSGASSVYTYGAYGASGASFTATETGYYLIQAWGSAGGAGQGALAYACRSSSSNSEYVMGTTGYGGEGGAGGAIYGFVYLEVGDVIKMNLSPIGTDYSNSVKKVYAKTGTLFGVSGAAAGSGGGGGGYSAVLLTKADGSVTNGVVMVAGGGSGGGGGGSARTTGDVTNKAYTGKAGNDSTAVSTTFDSDYSSYKGSTGNTPTVSNHNTIGVPGVTIGEPTAAGSSYKNTSLLNVGANNEETALINALTKSLYASDAIDKTAYNSYESSLNLGSAVQITAIASVEDVENLSALSSIEIEAETSEYFEVEDIYMSVPGLSYSTLSTSTNGGVTSVVYKQNGSIVYSLNYTLETKSNGSTVFRITDAAPAPTFEVSVANKTYTASSKFSISVQMNPRDGFLGGNDVPVLREADGSTGAGKSYFKVSGYGGSSYSNSNPAVDYANVSINYNLAADLIAADKTVVYPDYLTESPLTVADLYTLNYSAPTGADDWKDDYVYLVRPEEAFADASVTTSVTKTYSDLTAKLLPTVATPAKALVVGATNGVTASVSSTVTVKYHVNYDVTDLSYAGPLFAEYNNAFDVTFTATDDFSLPDSVTVKVGGVALSDGYTYDAETGVLSVDAAKVTDTVDIIAVGAIVEDETQVYKMYVNYYLYDSVTGEDVLQEEIVKEYYLNEKIDYAWFDALVAGIPSREGYTYEWEWEVSGGTAPEYMPGKDVYATGQYIKNRFSVTVHYVDELGATLFDSHVSEYDYGDAYSIPSPTKSGYLADKLTVSGTMGNGPVEVTVVYEKSAGKLVILYLYENGTEAKPRYEIELNEGESYSVASPTDVVGHYAETTVVSGTMASSDSVTVIVYYKPNQYKLNLKIEYSAGEYPGEPSFNTVGATSDGLSDITVEYGNVFGYNAELDKYGMPVPLHANYQFLGWYSDPNFSEDSRITEDMSVDLLTFDTLYAKWETVKYNLYVRYEYSYDTGDFLPDFTVLPDDMQDELKVAGGQQYVHELLSIIGYTPWKNHGLTNAEKLDDHKLIGLMAGEDTVVYVTYAINVYTIRLIDTQSESDITYPSYTSVKSVPDTQKVYHTTTAKHSANPVFKNLAFSSNTSEEYTFFHNGSYRNSETNEVFTVVEDGDENTLTLAKVYGDIDYTSCADAVENIAIVTPSGGASKYYSSVKEAADYLLSIASSSSSTPTTLRFRRNADVEKVIDFDAIDSDYPTLELDTATGKYVKVDLGGCKIKTSANAINSTLYLTVTDSVGGGRIEAVGSPVDASSNPLSIIGINATGGTVTFDSCFDGTDYDVLTVVSENGGAAKGIYCINACTFYGNMTVETAGAAHGIHFASSSATLNVYGNIDVTAGTTGYGIQSSYTTYLREGASSKVRSGTGYAYGVYVSSSNAYTYADTTIYAYSDGGYAYGLYSASGPYINYSGNGDSVITAHSAASNAYGVYSSNAIYLNRNETSGQVANLTINVRSDSELTSAIAYGVYSGNYIYANYNNYGCGDVEINVNTLAAKAYGLYNTSNYVYVNYNCNTESRGDTTINVTSVDGDAYGAYRSGSYVYLNYNYKGQGDSNITVSSENGTAYGAYGSTVYVNYNYNSAYASDVVIAVDGGNKAYGIYASSTSYVNYHYNTSSTGNTVITVACDGDAYGAYGSTVYANRYPQYGTLDITVNSTDGIAYGTYSSGASHLYAETDITASSVNGDAFGMSVAGSLNTYANTSVAPSTVSASSSNANATAVLTKVQSASLLYFDCSATAPAGTAIGLDITGSSSCTFGSSAYYLGVSSTGDTAIALNLNVPTTLYVNATANGTTEAYAIKAGSDTVRAHTIYGQYQALSHDGDVFGVLGPMSLTLTASASMSAETDGGTAYGIKDATVSSASAGCSVMARSVDGDAYGIDSDATIPQNFNVTAVTDGGIAYGIYVDTETAINIYGAATAVGKDAYALHLVGAASVNTNQYTSLSATSNGDTGSFACGVYVPEGATLSHTASATAMDVTASANYGTAYGIFNCGSITCLIADVIATSELGMAYGLYNSGAVTASGSDMDFKATSAANNAYGIYNESGSIGEDGEGLYLALGSAAGLTDGAGKLGYGIYVADGVIYLTGDTFYFKGTTENLYGDDEYGDGAEKIIIPDGYIQQLGADQATYPGYYVLIYVEYYIEFIDIVDGVEVRTKVAFNSSTTSIYVPDFIGKVGYAGVWGDYDLTPPTEGDTKEVYSTYIILQFTITINYGGGSGSPSSITQDYATAVTAPSNPTRAGYDFVGWYADSALTVAYTFTTMPAENITVYAGWDARTITITFETNGGTVISAISGDCDTVISMPSDPIRIGSAFLGWYTDSGYTNLFTSVTFPTQNITLYAKWNVTNFVAIAEGVDAYKAYTVKFYRNSTSTDSTVTKTFTLTADSLQTIDIPTPIHPNDSSTSSSKYAFAGWFTSRTMSSETYADLHGSLSDFDVLDGVEDGNVSFYAGWYSLTLGRDRYDITTSPTSRTLSMYNHDGNTSNNQWSYLYMTYTVKEDGDYGFSYLNYANTTSTHSNYHKNVEIFVRSLDGSTRTVRANGLLAHTNSITNYNVVTVTGLKKGDAIVLKAYQGSGADDQTYNTSIYAYVSSTPLMNDEPLTNSVNEINYNVDKGTIPLATLEDKSATRHFLGWTWKVDGELSDVIINEIDVSLLSIAPAWQDHSNPETLYLYPVWETPNVIWSSSVEDGRLFATFDTGENDVTIRKNATFTMLLSATGDDVTGSVAKIAFAKGLPAGTLLTLIDLSGAMPVYYTYTVGSGGLKELSFDSFSKMGENSTKFIGCSALMLLNVCYAGTQNTAEGEVLTFYVDGDLTTAADNTVSFIDTATSENSLGSMNMTHVQNATQPAVIPSLSGKGYSDDARVLFVMKFLDKNGNAVTIPAGVYAEIEGFEAVTYSDYIIADIGSVADYASGGTIYGTLYTNAYRYTEFDGKFVYELVVMEGGAADDACSYGGVNSSVVSRSTVNISIVEPLKITAAVRQDTLQPGNTIAITVSNANGALANEKVTVYVYQLVGSNLVPTQNGMTLLDGIPVDANGLVAAGNVWTDSNGNLIVPISAQAQLGVYYAKISYLDRYDVVVVEIVSDTQ